MEVLPDLLSWFDSRKRAVSRKLADAMTQGPTATLARMNAQRQEDIGQRNEQTVDMVNRGDWKGLAGMSGGDTVDPGPAGKAIFYGTLGARRLGTEDALKAGAERLKAGEPPKQVWQESGVARGANSKAGEYMQEMSDKYAHITPDAANAFNETGSVSGTVDQLFDHPELFKAHPQLAGLDASIKFGPSTKATYRMGPNNGGSIDITAPTMDEARIAMLHELQHGTQIKEGWTYNGANLKQEISKADDFNKGYWNYFSNPGELQARAVEKRANMGDAERQESPPSQTMQYLLRAFKQGQM